MHLQDVADVKWGHWVMHAVGPVHIICAVGFSGVHPVVSCSAVSPRNRACGRGVLFGRTAREPRRRTKSGAVAFLVVVDPFHGTSKPAGMVRKQQIVH